MLTALRTRAILRLRAATCRQSFHATVSLARGSDRPGDTIKRSDPADEKVFLEKVFLKKISRLNLKTPLFNSYQWWQENQTKIDGLKGSTRVTFALRPDIDQSFFLRYAIPRLLLRSVFLRQSGDNAVLILITPQFLRWTKNHDFMVSVLEACCPWERDSVAAVTAAVDKVWTDDPHGTPAEGLSLITGHVNEIFQSGSGSGSKANTGTLRFTMDALNKHRHPVAIDLPLANTLFHTGKEHSLLYSTWKRDRDMSFKISEKSRPVSELAISLTQVEIPEQSDRQARMDIDIQPRLISLTKPRKIKSCLGNIISMIKSENGKTVPASTELEGAVEILRKSRAEADTITQEPGTKSDGPPADQEAAGIWALVGHIPEELSSTSFDFKGAMNKLKIASGDYRSERDAASFNLDILRHLLERGFQLHRITSGGGGWDGKSGPLALEINSSDDLGASGEEDTLEMVLDGGDSYGTPMFQKGVLSPGAYIQFLTIPRPAPFKTSIKPPVSLKIAKRKAQPLFPRDLEREQEPHPFPYDMMFGKATDLLTVNEDSTISKPEDPWELNWDPLEHGIKATVGHFGALSVRGVSIRSVLPPNKTPSRPGDIIMRTKLDSPYSHVKVSCHDVQMGMNIHMDIKDVCGLEQEGEEVGWSRATGANVE